MDNGLGQNLFINMQRIMMAGAPYVCSGCVVLILMLKLQLQLREHVYPGSGHMEKERLRTEATYSITQCL